MVSCLYLFGTLGISVISDSGTRTVHAGLLMCSVDLPARCLCSNMKQFSGKYGCVYCKNPGVPRDGMPMVRDWPPGNQELRTHTSFVEDAREAVSCGEAVCFSCDNCTCIHVSTFCVSDVLTDSWYQRSILFHVASSI